jgi:hypothetical protein
MSRQRIGFRPVQKGGLFLRSWKDEHVARIIGFQIRLIDVQVDKRVLGPCTSSIVVLSKNVKS